MDVAPLDLVSRNGIYAGCINETELLGDLGHSLGKSVGANTIAADIAPAVCIRRSNLQSAAVYAVFLHAVGVRVVACAENLNSVCLNAHAVERQVVDVEKAEVLLNVVVEHHVVGIVHDVVPEGNIMILFLVLVEVVKESIGNLSCLTKENNIARLNMLCSLFDGYEVLLVILFPVAV